MKGISGWKKFKFISSMNNDLSDFLSGKELYTKFEIEDTYRDDDILGTTFKFFCEVDKDFTTFEIQDEKNPNIPRKSPFSIGLMNIASNSTMDYEFHTHYTGICQACKEYKAHFLINGFTLRNKKENKKEFYIRKVGQDPAPTVIAPKEISAFLNAVDNDFYQKALKNLKYGHGIGAYSYFRRVIENEIYRVVEKISELNSPTSYKDKLSEALSRYKINHQMSNLIEEITPYLPKSLKEEHSENILRLLYNQSSIALHELSEEQCLEKAESIDKLFLYLVKKLNEEKYENDEIKKAIKKLK
jgi:hypothetical protein